VPALLAPREAGKPRSVLLYLTANDERSFVVDMLHFHRMARLDPGVPLVEVVIVISRASEVTDADQRSVEWLLADCADCPWLAIRSVIWKDNVGRDFSSAAAGLAALGGDLEPDDFIMVRNRSGYGPFVKGWYRKYVDQYCRHPGTALTGSTICLRGHPKLESDPPWAHVQTYVYLSQWRHLQALAGDFPGSGCSDRTQTIVAGEIGLSRHFLMRGARISSLHWPDLAFDTLAATITTLPRIDFKSHDLGLPIRYKYPAYLRGVAQAGLRTRWWWRRVFASRAPSPVSDEKKSREKIAPE
jgi:hypothetical protein